MRFKTFILCLLLSMQLSGQTSTLEKSAADGIHRDSSIIMSWATTIKIIAGFVDISDRESGRIDAADSSLGLGVADNRTVSLGDSGVAVVGFSQPVVNNTGPDFAVFENSFDGYFLELATVEVSSDSTRWVAFHSVSLTDTMNQVATFGKLESNNIFNLAGKHRGLYGTPFDLEELKDSSGIDIENINYIRLTDVIGRVDHPYPVRASNGYIINDPWPTPFESSGFDLDAVAILGTGVSAPLYLQSPTLQVYPNPAKTSITVQKLDNKTSYLRILSLDGKEVKLVPLKGERTVVGIEDLSEGIYYLTERSRTSMTIPLVIRR